MKDRKHWDLTNQKWDNGDVKPSKLAILTIKNWASTPENSWDFSEQDSNQLGNLVEKWLWQWRIEFGSICLKEQIHILHRSSQNLLESQQLGLCGTQQFNPFSIWGQSAAIFKPPRKFTHLPINMGKLANILRITVQSSTAFQAMLNPK